MKKFAVLVFALTVSGFTKVVGAETKTPITDNSYRVMQRSAYESCLEGVVKTDQGKTFCMCASASIVANTRKVVTKYHLQFEEELVDHMGECVLTQSQVNVCVNRSQ